MRRCNCRSAGAGGIQLEEVPAASLRAGRNEIVFEPNATLGPSGYIVRAVELLCIDDVEQQIDRAVPASSLTDDDPTTGATAAAAVAGQVTASTTNNGAGQRLLRWDVREGEQPHIVAFRTVGSVRGTLELRGETRAHAFMSQRVSLAGRGSGWHDVVLPDRWPEGAITAHVALERESTGSVAELRVVSSAIRGDASTLVVTFPHRSECVGQRSQVRAFVRGTSERDWTFSAGGVRAAAPTNAIVVLDNVPAPLGGAQEIEIRATSGALVLSEWISLAPCQPENIASSARADEGAPFSVVATPNASTALRAGALRVEIPAGSVTTNTRVTARPLAATDVQPLDQGMENVTGGGSAWRLGPSPMRFLRGLKIAVAIARDRLPAGKTERDVKLYYFDEGARQWRQVASEAIDGFVVAQTDHFTDWVAATITAPEAPESSAGNANSLGQLGAGHPLAGVLGASVPTANSQGTATTAIPIELPPGRAGMQPSVSLLYDSSSTASGYVSAGWSLPIPAISIDTRFGVPTYSGNEHYTLNGAAITFVEALSNGAGGEIRDRFEPRVLGSNARIVRVRSGAVVRWEVTDTNGTTTHYGETSNARLTANASATVPPITPELGARPLFSVSVERTAVWFASRVVDTHANEVQYIYRMASGTLAEVAPGIPAEPWVQLYPERIEYTTTTGAPAGSAYYKVFFEFEPRKESGTSARFGFLTHNQERLRAIRVEAGGLLTKKYRLNYGEDDFGRAQFGSLDVIGTDGIATLHRQQFDYYRAPRDSAGGLGFTSATDWSPAPEFALESGFGNSGGGTGYAGFGDPAYLVNIGAGGGYTRSGSHNEVVTTDVNGDGLPDFFHRDGRLRLNRFATSLGGALDRTRGALENFAPISVGSSFIDEHADHASLRFGVSLLSGIGAIGATGGWNWSAAGRLFVDVDGDGRPDIINGPLIEEGVPVLPVRFNPFAMNTNRFGGFSAGGGENARDYQLGGLVPNEQTRTVELPPDLASAPRMFYRTAPLVRWKAQQSGIVKLEGTIVRPGVGGDGVTVQVIRVQDSGLPSGTVHWSQDVSTTCTPSGSNGCDGASPPTFWVNSGDRVYFLVHGKETFDLDAVQWQPRLTYLSYGPCTTPQQPDPDVFCSSTPTAGMHFDRGEDFRLADRDTVGFVAHRRGRVRFQGNWASTGLPFRIYRRRVVLPPGAPPLPTIDASTVVDAAFLTDLFGRVSSREVALLHDYGAAPSGSFGAGLDIDVFERDELIFHFLAPHPTDPAALSSFNVSARYTHLAHESAGGFTTLFAISPCGPDPTPLPGLPSGAMPPRICTVPGSPGGVSILPESLVVYPTIAPAIGAALPSGSAPNTQRSDAMLGYYRGWSYAEWNSDITFTEEGVRQPFPQSTVELITAATSSPMGAIDPPRMNPMTAHPAGSRFLLGPDDGTGDNLLADIAVPLWRGRGIDTFATAQLLKPSANAPFRFDPITRRVIRTTARGASKTDAPSLRGGYARSVGVNFSLSVGGGGSALGLRGEHSSTQSFNDLDFFDFNGDGLPDSIRWNGTSGFVQLQRPRVGSSPIGEFSPPIPFNLPARPALRRIETVMGVGGFSYGSNIGSWSASVGANGTVSGAESANGGGAVSHAYSQHRGELFDINGDGIADSVNTVMDDTQAHYDVAFGLGHGFSARVKIPMPGGAAFYAAAHRGSFVRENCTVSGQVSVGPAGAGASFASSRLRVATIDINGDGFADRVWRNMEETDAAGRAVWWVEINTGGEFTTAQRWSLPSLPSAAGGPPPPNSICRTESPAGGTGTFEDTRTVPAVTNSWTISASAGEQLRIWTPFIAFLVEAGISPLNHDWTATDIAMNDIDGDGNVDHVVKANGRIFARLNDLGRTGLLRSITGPTGGVLTLDYAREGNHISASPTAPRREMPSNRWVLSSVKVSDPAGDSYTTTFDYHSSGNFDRREREFYGFAQVTHRRSDGARVETHYHNQDYYRRGTAHTKITFDKDGNMLSRSVFESSAPPLGLPAHTGRFFSEHQSNTSYVYPGTSPDPMSFVAQSRTRFSYTANYLVREVFEDRDLSTLSDDRRVVIDYSFNTSAWIIATTSAVLFDSAGNVLQRRTSSVDGYGDVRWVEDRLVGGVDPITNTPWTGAAGRNPRTTFKYDGYGNLHEITDPSGFWRSFVYDAVTHSRVETTTNAFGLSSFVEWNHRLALPTITTDTNGVKREVRYDVFGRVTEVFEPYEFGTTTPTVRYDYGLGSIYPPPSRLWARSRTIDPSHPGDTIDAIVFLDGLGRVLQTKREIEVEKTATSTQQGWTVSGLVERDEFGRVIRTHEPTFSDNLSPFFVAPMPSTAHPARVEYDNFGRVWRQTAPNNDQTTIAYGFESLGGALRTSVSVTDPLGRVRHSFSDFNGNLVRNRSQVTTGGALTTVETSYAYDALDRLVLVTDAQGNETTAEYDSLGAMVSLTNPDTGTVEYQHTISGDLGAKITPNLRPHGQRIEYQRTYHRLDAILYPSSPSVTYTYGGPGASFNAAGRVQQVTDGSGTQEFRYGLNGEMLWHQRVLGAWGTISSPTTTTMTFAYDSLGRMQNITYPDGESVAYAYDRGGNLESAASSARTYVSSIHYDHFGRRTRVRSGNGTETVYTFDAVISHFKVTDSCEFTRHLAPDRRALSS